MIHQIFKKDNIFIIKWCNSFSTPVFYYCFYQDKNKDFIYLGKRNNWFSSNFNIEIVNGKYKIHTKLITELIEVLRDEVLEIDLKRDYILEKCKYLQDEIGILEEKDTKKKSAKSCCPKGKQCSKLPPDYVPDDKPFCTKCDNKKGRDKK